MEKIKNTVVFPIEMACREIVERAEKIMLDRIACTRKEMWVLLCVNDAQLSQKKIGEILKLHQNRMVKLLDAMVRRGLAERVTREGDRRENIIELTGEGKRRMLLYLELRVQLITEIFRPLTTEEIEQWRILARRLLDGR